MAGGKSVLFIQNQRASQSDDKGQNRGGQHDPHAEQAGTAGINIAGQAEQAQTVQKTEETDGAKTPENDKKG